MHGTDLHWLPENPSWAEQLAEVTARGAGKANWSDFVPLARSRLSAMQTIQLDRRAARATVDRSAEGLGKPIRLAVLASSTVDQLLPAIRVGGLRRSIPIEIYTPHYGQYAQELLDTTAELSRFAPDAILFALDARHLLQGIDPSMPADAVRDTLTKVLDRLSSQWAIARQICGGQILQNIPLPVFLPLIGNNEHRLAGSPLAALRDFVSMLRHAADAAAVDLIALDDQVVTSGLTAWHDPALWHRAKQEIHPQAAPLYGDLVARLIAAAQGQSKKCLVLDLDNTLWGGVIGDDGLAGIKLGQGSARGEAHLAFQHYAKDLAARGVILAVCSKNDEANALEPFLSHPEMALKRTDIACFVANWTDKASNLRDIARRLNIGIDSLVFVDDNPAERAIIRRELPTVAVPELPEDPTSYAEAVASAGYFEAVRVTAEDSQRAQQYQHNVARESLLTSATDMAGYLRSLSMRAVWSGFGQTGLARIVQLINKTNQFNLTTRRVSETEVQALIDDPAALTLQIRLIDQFGDNGIIAIVSGQLERPTLTVRLDTWLMSCRVLGRGMETETLNLVAAEAIRLGAQTLVGTYRPTAKNGMVRDHYERLGFTQLTRDADDQTTWTLDLANYVPRETFITSRQLSADIPALTAA